MAETKTQISMREIRPGEVPRNGGTAIQDDASRPVFHGNGPFDYVCVECGTVLASGMEPEYMTKKVRVKCAVCRTVNVAITEQAGRCDVPK
jgi:DNA-directed RNA polymerase subunit RPC12/RpoP